MASNQGAKPINLALQGGGSHGAFSWGVLDRLLEDDRLVIEAVTGASAGAMNAVVLADGLANGSKEEARHALRAFWEGVGEAAKGSPIKRSPVDAWRGVWNLDSSPAYLWFDLLSRVASPYDINPFQLNPLRDLVKRLVDFDRVRACNGLQVFISATNVETGRAKVFHRHELTADHVMASACLPDMYQAVEIEGCVYWDGGYMGNPPLWPLFDHANSHDVVLVQINPFYRKGAPTKARDIFSRLNEITFNASLLRELRSIDFITSLLEAGRLEGTGYRPVYLHMIGDEAALSALGASSKLNAEEAFLQVLFERGRAAADQWLATCFAGVGERSTLDLDVVFAGEDDPLDGKRIHRDAAFRSGKPGASPGPGSGKGK
jgi:NTE family protein